MKIEKLIFRNLNSIEGKWEIDFSNPLFESTGLFAITGPTGSGKSTILDAIALALYGQTPRLGLITDKRNELMTKGAGICSSEIVFRTLGKRYRSSWSQNRSRMSSEGPLQKPETKLEVFDFATGEYEGISEGKKQFISAVSEAIGLTFPQFCRSVLLAQGQFAAFLRADKDVRAQSLEQITGTEIYGDISALVHKKRGIEVKKYDDMKKDLEKVTTLDPDERKRKETLQKQLTKEEKELTERVTDLKFALEWMERYEELVKQKNKLLEELEALEKDSETLKNYKDKERKAQIAKEIQHLFNSLGELRNRMADNAKEINDLKDKLNNANQKKQDLVSKEKSKDAQKTQHEIEEGKLKALVQKVRPLDSKIQVETAEEKKASETKAENEAKLTELQNKFNTTQAGIQKTEGDIKGIQQWLDEHQAEAVLTEDKASITYNKATWKANTDALKEAQQKASKAKKDYSEKQKERENAEVKAGQAEKTFSDEKEKLQSLKDQLSKVLQGGTIEQLSEDKLEIANRLHNLSSALSLVDIQKDNLEALGKANKKITEFSQKENDQTALANKLRDLVNSKSDQLKDAEWKLQVASLEERRKDLKPGEPCPLCGSLDHPYCINLPESKDTILSKKRQLEVEKGKAEKEFLQAEKASSVAKTQVTSEKNSLPSLEQACTEGQKKCEEAGNALNVPWNGDLEAFKAELLRNQGEAESKQKDLNSTFEKATSIRKDISKAESDQGKAEAAHQALQLQLSGLKVSVQALEKNKQETIKEEATKNTAVQENLSVISNRWGKFYEGRLEPKAVPEFLKQLLQKEEAYSKKLDARKNLSVQLTSAKNLAESQDADVKSQTLALQRAKEVLTAATDQLNRTVAERKALFQDKDCDEELRKSEAKGKQIGDELDQLRSQISQFNTTIAALTSTQNSAKKTSEDLTKQEEKAVGVWNATLIEKGFGSEEQWQQSRLSDEDIANLHEWIKNYEDKKTLNKSQIDANSGLINSELEKKNENEKLKELTVFSESELKGLEVQAEADQEYKKEELLKVSVELEQDKEHQERKASISADADRQWKVCQNWDELHSLIGSGAGKVYREYAQGMTCQILVRKANMSLKKLSSRFLLCIRKNTNLELDIKDLDLLDRIRPIDNLSGGETFLVSLALALGLSEMAGQNVRIDS
ncbi:MAG: AAA family ATPase, partial [Burkholderiales bacterium]|nr:AAA family ATPase [Burkholderiales bacterium]